MAEIKNVLIIGSGTMGLQIALQCASCEFDVVVFDVSEQALQDARMRLPSLARKLVRSNRMDDAAAALAMDRMRFSSDAGDAGKDADIVSESVPEDPVLKGKVFARFNAICPDHTIFTTNTSTLVPSMFSDATGRPSQFAALHFHDVALTNMVDIMPHPGTSDETIASIRQFVSDIRQYPIMLNKEQPGYVFNTMMSQWMSAALTLASNDVAGVEEIDRAWMGIMGSPIGPFGLMDSIGLETVWKVTDYWANATANPQGVVNAEFLRSFVNAGTLGVKTGSGFYEYPEPLYSKPAFLDGVR